MRRLNLVIAFLLLSAVLASAHSEHHDHTNDQNENDAAGVITPYGETCMSWHARYCSEVHDFCDCMDYCDYHGGEDLWGGLVNCVYWGCTSLCEEEEGPPEV